MNAAVMIVTRYNYSTAIDWSRMQLEQWLEQYGAWLNVDNPSVSLKAHSIMLDIMQCKQTKDKRHRCLPRCSISDNEAMAVHWLLCDMDDTQSPVVKSWLRTLTRYRVNAWSQEQIADSLDVGREAVKQDLACAIAHICARRPGITSFLTSKWGAL